MSIFKKILAGLVILAFISVIMPNTTEENKSDKPQPIINQEETKEEIWSEAEQERFNKVANEWDEVDSIECYESNCSVVYFYYNTNPLLLKDDVKMIIRTNALSLSKRKSEQTGVSHITIIAKYKGQTIYTCDCSKGKMPNCK